MMRMMQWALLCLPMAGLSMEKSSDDYWREIDLKLQDIERHPGVLCKSAIYTEEEIPEHIKKRDRAFLHHLGLVEPYLTAPAPADVYHYGRTFLMRVPALIPEVQVAVAQLFLLHGQAAQAVDNDGSNLLFYVRDGYFCKRFADCMIEKGAEINCVNHYKQSPLIKALVGIGNVQPKLAFYLLQKGADRGYVLRHNVLAFNALMNITQKYDSNLIKDTV